MQRDGGDEREQESRQERGQCGAFAMRHSCCLPML
jgi:hypothetical protein